MLPTIHLKACVLRARFATPTISHCKSIRSYLKLSRLVRSHDSQAALNLVPPVANCGALPPRKALRRSIESEQFVKGVLKLRCHHLVASRCRDDFRRRAERHAGFIDDATSGGAERRESSREVREIDARRADFRNRARRGRRGRRRGERGG